MNCTMEIKDIIAAVSIIPAEEINIEDPLSSIGIDSLKSVELIVALEDGLNIRFDDSDLDPGKLSTIKSVIDLVEKYF